MSKNQYTVNVWEEEDGAVGYEITRYDGPVLDPSSLLGLLAEVEMAILEKGNDTTVLKLSLTESGLLSMNKQKNRRWDTLTDFLVTRHNLHFAHTLLYSTGRRPSNLRHFIWRVEWRLLKLMGRFNASESRGARRVPRTPSLTQEAIDEAFEGLPIAFLGGSGKVVPLHSIGKP